MKIEPFIRQLTSGVNAYVVGIKVEGDEFLFSEFGSVCAYGKDNALKKKAALEERFKEK